MCELQHIDLKRDTDDILAIKDGANLLQGLGHVEADVGHLVVGHFEDHRQHLLGGDLLTTRL